MLGEINNFQPYLQQKTRLSMINWCHHLRGNYKEKGCTWRKKQRYGIY